MNFAISYSGGKDSALALYRMIQQGHTPVAMITTVNPEQDRSWFHGIQKELLLAVSESLDIPLIIGECEPDDYTETLQACLVEAKRQGAEACVFGDIDIDEHRAYDEEICAESGLECLLPLWLNDRTALVNELLEAGFKAIIKIVDTSKLDASLLGQKLTTAIVQKIVSAGADICGENGEYHTFVSDGPIFKTAVPIELGEIVDLNSHMAIDLKYGGIA